MSNPSIPRRAGKCLLCGGFLCGNLTEVYENFTKLRFLTLHFFSILGNVNEVKKKESSEKGHAADLHRGALIATAVVLFVFILIINFSVSMLNRRKDNE